MPYEDIPILHVLNYWLADAFDVSGELDLLVWLGDGKSLSEMFTPEELPLLYTQERRQELAGFIRHLGVDVLEDYLNDGNRPYAVLLDVRNHELVFSAGRPEGKAAILTDWFKRDRASAIR
jgi:hypothetical protein